MTEEWNNQRLPVSEIVIPDGRHHLQEDKVKDLADAMQRLGMLSPIGVRMLGGKPHLVYGFHRLAVSRVLGWDEIDCRIFNGDDRHARMAEIAENLHRAELTALERSEQVDEWIRLAEEMKQEISAQVAQKFGPGLKVASVPLRVRSVLTVMPPGGRRRSPGFRQKPRSPPTNS